MYANARQKFKSHYSKNSFLHCFLFGLRLFQGLPFLAYKKDISFLFRYK